MTAETIIPDPVALRGLSDPLRLTIIAIYRELAAGNYLLGHHDLVERCQTNADALEYGGDASLAGADR